MRVNSGIGRYSPVNDPTGPDFVLEPRLRPAVALPPLIYCHGSSVPAAIAVGFSGTGQPSLLQNICELGRYVVVCQLGASLTNWANAQAMAALTDAVAWAIAKSGYTGTAVHLAGASAGHAVASRWAAMNPSKVRSISGFIPVTGLQWCRDNNTQLRTTIDAAWGVSYPAPLPAGADPFTDPAQIAVLKTIPWQGFAASDDTGAAPLVNTQAWGAVVRGAVTSLGALGHTDAAIGAVPFPSVVKLLTDHDN